MRTKLLNGFIFTIFSGIISNSSVADCIANIDVLPGHRLDKIRISNLLELNTNVDWRIISKSGEFQPGIIGSVLPPFGTDTLTVGSLFKDFQMAYDPKLLIHLDIRLQGSGDLPNPPAQVTYITHPSGPVIPVTLSCN
jgi:hypothetical protein